jgi:hypothetical protein
MMASCAASACGRRDERSPRYDLGGRDFWCSHPIYGAGGVFVRKASLVYSAWSSAACTVARLSLTHQVRRVVISRLRLGACSDAKDP